MLIEFITDVEGNWEYWCSQFEASKALEGTPNKPKLKDGWMFCHGGDVVDRGSGDIRICKAFTQLHHNHKERVILIAGNHELGKLRFASELAEGEERRLDVSSLSMQAAPFHEWFDPDPSFQGASSSVRVCRWMLQDTMGGYLCTFETRRKELAMLGRASGDDDVALSFRDSVDPMAGDPWLLKYLKCTQIVAVVDDCLFVHGGVPLAAKRELPSGEAVDLPIGEWVDKVNIWYRAQLAGFEASPRWSERGARGGDALMHNDGWFCPLIYDALVSRAEGERYNPVHPQEEVSAWLCTAGIRRVFSGHQPAGECPQPVRAPAPFHPLCFFMCDTSFSDMDADKSENPFNTRGRALSSVWISLETTEVSGVLNDGSPHGYILQADGDDAMPAVFIGQRLKELPDPVLPAGSWVKTLTPPPGEGAKQRERSSWLPLVSRVDGYRHEGFREDGQRGLLLRRTVESVTRAIE